MQDLTLFNTDTAKATTQDIQVFNCELGNIRAIIENGEPLFCLVDICKALDLSNPTMVANAIKAEFEGCKFNLYPLETSGGAQNFTFITESQLYFVLMRSKSTKAKPFRQRETNRTS